MIHVRKLTFVFFCFSIILVLACPKEEIVSYKFGGYIVDRSTDIVIDDCTVTHESETKYTNINGYFEFEKEFTIISDGSSVTQRTIGVYASKSGYITSHFTLYPEDLDARYKLTPE
ncbi:MAG: hypothetical protein KAT05_08520 [Spirochaetes bacterium]|nr:hypothetical protein [Spirochaetota bacterium]